jgi:hypothetical protein
VEKNNGIAPQDSHAGESISWTHTKRTNGNAQNNNSSPRTSWRSEGIKSGWSDEGEAIDN